MKRTLRRATLGLVLLVVPISGPVGLGTAGKSFAAHPAQVQTANAAFQQVWTRTDWPVQSGQAKRSFYWGYAGGQPMYERYDEGPGGKHLVQYFDKSRMEINDPNGDPANPFYVTNGQLARELITGRVQVGNAQFIQLPPAQVDIASDTSDTSPGTPTYASFGSVVRVNPGQVGQPVNGTISRAGQVGTDQSYWARYRVRYAYYEPATQNNIPDVFWDFLNSTGLVIINGRQVNARLSDPYFYATGYPISAAYWASVTIAGQQNTAVLIQAYERRVLTFVPSAPEGWRVQMGNVGLHYFEWRYRSGRHSCDAPGGKTGKLWFDRPDVQQLLGCVALDQPETGVTVAHQAFEHGQMLDLIRRTGLKTIYVLFEDGTASVFTDDFQDGSPEPELNPPPDLYTPKHGFGKVWREANLEGRLGWATSPETVANQDPGGSPPVPTPLPTAQPGMPTPRPAPPPPTAVPPSSRGFPAVRSFGSRGLGANLVIYTGPVLHMFYVTYGFGTRWVAFEDAH